MKKLYIAPRSVEHSFEFRDGIAIDVDPFNPTSDVFAKERRDEEVDDADYNGNSEWQNGLW